MFRDSKIETFKENHRIFNRSVLAFRRNLCNQGSRFGRRTPADYSLYAKCIIAQLLEQKQYNILSISIFREQETEIIRTLKKCQSLQRGEALIKMLALYSQQKWEPIPEIITMFDDVFLFLTKIMQAETEKFIDLIVYEGVDKGLSYLLSFWSLKNRNLGSIEKIVFRMLEIKQQFEKKMTEKQYADLQLFLSQWCPQKNIVRSKGLNRARSLEKSLCSKSGGSDRSISSENSIAYRQRIQKFAHENINQQFSKKIQSFSNSRRLRVQRNSRCEIGRKSIGSYNTTKRVSSSWGRFESSFASKSHTFKKKLEGKQLNQELSLLSDPVHERKKSQDAITRNLIPVSEQMTVIGQGHFYLFMWINERIRVVEIKQIRLSTGKQANRIQVCLQGYFQYQFGFRTNVSGRDLLGDRDLLQQTITQSIEIERKGLWYRLHPKSKVTHCHNPENTVIFKLCPQRTEIEYYSFIKQFNVYFFAKLLQSTHNQQKQQENAMLLIYDSKLEIILQQRYQNSNATLDYFNQAECRQERDQQLQVGLDTYPLQIIHSGLPKHNKATLKTIRSKMNPMQRFRNQPLAAHNQYFETLDKQSKYTIFSFKQEYQHQILGISNSKSVLNPWHLFTAKSTYNHIFQQPASHAAVLKHSIAHHLSKQSQKHKSTILNRRMKNQELTTIKMQCTFIKKARQIGIIMFKLLVFDESLFEVSLLEAYVPKLQKYYQFEVKRECLTALLKDAKFKGIQCREFLKSLVAGFKRMKVGFAVEPNYLLNKINVEIDGQLIQGRQLLLRHSINDRGRLQAVQWVSVKAPKGMPYEHDELIFTKHTLQMSLKLLNYSYEHFRVHQYKHLSNFQLEFLEISHTLARQQAESRLTQRPAIKQQCRGRFILVHNCNCHQLFYLRFEQSCDLIIRKYKFRPFRQRNYKLGGKDMEEDIVFSRLSGHSRFRYLARCLKANARILNNKVKW